MEKRIRVDKAEKVENAIRAFTAAGIRYETTDKLHFRLCGGKMHYWPSTSHLWDEVRNCHRNLYPKDVLIYISNYYSAGENGVASITPTARTYSEPELAEIFSSMIARIEALEDSVRALQDSSGVLPS